MRIGKLEVTAPFFLMLAWLNYLDRQGLVPLCVLACCFHELGHLLSIRLLSGDIKLIRLTAVGAEMVLCRPMGYGQEMVAALAGPGVNLLLAVLCCRWSWGTLFAGLNLALGCFAGREAGRRPFFTWIAGCLLWPECGRANWSLAGRMSGRLAASGGGAAGLEKRKYHPVICWAVAAGCFFQRKKEGK